MKRFAAIGSVLAILLSWSVYSAAGKSPQFPEPTEGYRNELAGYDDVPPENPAAIDVGPVEIDGHARQLSNLPIMDLHDGLEITGTLMGISNSDARVACIAIDMTRQLNQEHQLIATHSDFFELNNGTAAFTLPIRMPNYHEPMQITLLVILLDEDGMAVGTESILATSTEFIH